MKKITRAILIFLAIAFIIIQFIRPAQNAGEEVAQHQIGAAFQVPGNVHQVLKVSCYDCHSNTTYYPWYNTIQPVNWFLNDHIVEGKGEVNFSIFATYPIWKQYKKFKEIEKQVKEDEMPLFSYTVIHRDAVLNTDQKLLLQNWATSNVKQIEAKYPADSLVRPKRP